MPILIAIGLVACAVWSIWLVPRVSLLILSAIYLIAAAVAGYDIWNVHLGVSLSVDRIVLLLLLGCFTVHYFTQRIEKRDVPASEWLLFGFLGLLIVNTFAHDWRRSTPDQVPIVPHLVDGYLIPLALYWIARHAVLRQKYVDAIYILFTLLGVYLSLTALCEIVGAWGFVFPRKIADPTLGIHFGRARGPFLQSVRLGIYLLCCLSMSWTLLVWRNRFGRRGQVLGVLLTPLYVAAIGATLTRSIWLGFGLAAAILIGLTWRVRWRRAAYLAMFFAALLVVVVGKNGLVAFKRETTAADTKQSTDMRAVFAYVSYLMIKERPIAGFGFGHFPREKDKYLNDRATRLQMETIRGYIHHNTYLSIFVELGVFGFLLMCAFWTAWVVRGYRLWADATAPPWMRGQALVFLLVAAAYLVQMVFHEVTYSAVENGLLFLLAGLTSGMVSAVQPAAPQFSWQAIRRRLSGLVPHRPAYSS